MLIFQKIIYLVL